MKKSDNQFFKFEREVTSQDYQVLNQMLDYFRVSAFFENNTATQIFYAFGLKNSWQTLPQKVNTMVFGANAFDGQHSKEELMNGFWFEPEIVVSIANGRLQSNTVELDSILANHQQTHDVKRVQIKKIISETDWIQRVDDLIKNLNDVKSPIDKVVFGRQEMIELSNQNRASCLLQALRMQHNVYHVILKRENEIFVSATPERLVFVSQGEIQTAAVAGTTPRDRDPHRDRELGNSLLHSLKNQREHQFVVDSIKMKLEAITTQLNVPSNPILLQNKQVQHLYTPISGILSANMSVKDLVDNLHPTPALGGVPQKEALQYIAQHEQQPRGLFAGPIGYVTADNTGELVVGIRSMYCEQTRARLFAGAGIVAGSEAQQEYDETALKFKPMLQLLGELTHD